MVGWLVVDLVVLFVYGYDNHSFMVLHIITRCCCLGWLWLVWWWLIGFGLVWFCLCKLFIIGWFDNWCVWLCVLLVLLDLFAGFGGWLLVCLGLVWGFVI